MRIAIPLVDGQVAMHFGHCEQFALIDVDADSGEIGAKEMATPPGHAPGVLPQWLGERGVNVIIAGGMGSRAQGLFTQQNIEVVVGASAQTPEELVAAYIGGILKAGENICDH